MSFLFGTPQVNANIQAPNVNFTPPNFSGGGLGATFANNGYSLNPSGARNTAVGNVANTFGQQANALGALRQQWAPGSSALRQSLMTSLNNQRTQALGNLRDNLAQRRVLGSSFAQNSLANADQSYQQGIQQIQSQTYLQELSVQQSLIQQQYTAATNQFQTGLNEMNLEAGLASKLSMNATSAMASAANTQAQLQMQTNQQNLNAQEYNATAQSNTNAGIGSLFGSLLTAPLTGGTSLLGMGLSGLGGLMGGAASGAGTGLSLAGTGGLY